MTRLLGFSPVPYEGFTLNAETASHSQNVMLTQLVTIRAKTITLVSDSDL
jgi:hypothetical protein